MRLSEKRCLFSRLISEHMFWLSMVDQNFAIDEATEHITAKDPTSDHMKKSLHHSGLAIDLVFYDKDYNPLTTTESHKMSGEMWEGRHPLCRWGGRFNDGGHYSLEHEGRK